MTSRSSVGSTQVVLQFDISRDIDGAARDVQAAINAARADLPAALRSNPTYRKFNPSDLPIMILALTSKTLTPGQIYDQASNILQQKLSQMSRRGRCLAQRRLAAGHPHRTQSPRLVQIRHRAGRCARRGLRRQRQQPQGRHRAGRPALPDLCQRQSASRPADYKTLIVAYRNNAAVRLQDVADVYRRGRRISAIWASPTASPRSWCSITKQPGANVIEVVDSINAHDARTARRAAARDRSGMLIHDTTISIRNSVRDVEDHPGALHHPGGAGGVPVPAQFPRHAGAGGLGAAGAAGHLRHACICWASAWTISR